MLYIKYDKDKFNLLNEHENNYYSYSLYDLNGNKIASFEGEIGCLIQINKGNSIHFVVTHHYPQWTHNSFEHYLLDENAKKLKKVCSIESDFYEYDDVYVTEDTFLIKEGKEYILYNLEKISKAFAIVYNERHIKRQIDENVIMVTEKIKSQSDLIEDEITYGIDIKNYTVVTLVWSKLQQRFIDINKENFHNSIKKYLDLLEQYLQTDDENIIDDEVFLKKFFPVQ